MPWPGRCRRIKEFPTANALMTKNDNSGSLSIYSTQRKSNAKARHLCPELPPQRTRRSRSGSPKPNCVVHLTSTAQIMPPLQSHLSSTGLTKSEHLLPLESNNTSGPLSSMFLERQLQKPRQLDQVLKCLLSKVKCCAVTCQTRETQEQCSSSTIAQEPIGLGLQTLQASLEKHCKQHP